MRNAVRNAVPRRGVLEPRCAAGPFIRARAPQRRALTARRAGLQCPGSGERHGAPPIGNTVHPVDPWQPLYTVNVKGYTAPQSVPHLSGMDWYGIRVNMELYKPDDPGWVYLGNPPNNVQTFLIVQGAASGAGGGEEGLLLARSPAARESAGDASAAALREIAARRRR